jgi:hypothetical protein
VKALLKEYRECNYKKTLVFTAAGGLLLGSLFAFSAGVAILSAFDLSRPVQMWGGGVSVILFAGWLLRKWSKGDW